MEFFIIFIVKRLDFHNSTTEDLFLKVFRWVSLLYQTFPCEKFLPYWIPIQAVQVKCPQIVFQVLFIILKDVDNLEEV